MKSFVQPRLLNAPPRMEIEAGRYASLRNAREVLSAAFEVEESFDLLLGNYVDVERHVLDIALDSLVRCRFELAEQHADRAGVNRSVVNFLCSARLFIDFLSKRAARIGLDASHVRNLLSQHYDASFEYRFAEELRNHVQHRGLAVHLISQGARWLPPGHRHRGEHTVQVFALRRHLTDASGFKPRVLQECPDQIDLLTVVRKYLESLGDVLHAVRSLADTRVSAAREVVSRMIGDYAHFAGSPPVGLTAYVETEVGGLESTPVFLDWDDIRLELAKRNASLANLSKRYVTSRPEEP